ncbi:gp58-like family protein [Lactococcus hircilactis]|uniref:gp58-like family protein n=1 Tax=Lactococcus hircilactis TaxID=1494462 RepID=UPI003FA2CA97
MLKTSDAFNQAFKSPTRQVLARVSMGNIVYTNNDLFNVEYTGGSITGESFSIGSTFSNSIKITFAKVIEAVKQLDKIKLEFGIVLADGSTEFVSMGYFFVDKYNPDRNANRTIIEAFDEMPQLGGDYVSKLNYPARIKDVALEIANLSGTPINQAGFDRLSTLPINKIEGKTYRQALGMIAQFACGYAIFDRNGNLDIRMLSDPNFSISTADYFSKGLTKNETMYQLGGISCKVSSKSGDTSTDSTLQSGSTTGNQIVLENSVMTQTLLDGIYSQLKTINYYPFTLTWRGNPALEAGDWIGLSDVKANSFKMPNLSYKLTFSGGLKATSSADTSSVAQSTTPYRGALSQQVDELQGWKNASGGWTYNSVTEPVNPQEGDVWFKPNGSDTETWIYENGAWVFKTSTAGIREAKESAANAASVGQQAQQTANDAKTAGDKATVAATQASSDAATATKNANDAVTKANNSLTMANDAKTQASTANANANTALTNANTAISNVNKVSDDVKALNTLANTANSNANTALTNANKGMSDAKTALDNFNNLKIGGRNYLRNSNFTDGLNYWSNNPSNAVLENGVVKIITTTSNAFMQENIPQLSSGDVVTLSFDAKTDDSGILHTEMWGDKAHAVDIPLTKDFARYSTTFTVSDKNTLYFWNKNSSFNYIRKLKLEIGNKATDWSPSPDDVQIKIDSINNQLSTKVSQTSFDTLNGIVASQGTQITQNKSDILTKADKTYVDTLKGTVDTQGTQITQNAKDIQVKANQSSVDTLTGRVKTNESNISINANGVSSLVTKTDGTNTNLSKLNQDYTGFKQTVYTKTETDTKVSTVQQSVDQYKITVSNTYATKDLALQYKGTIGGTDSADNLADGWYSLDGWKNLVSGIVWGKLTSQGNNDISHVAQVAVIGNGDTYTRAKQGNPPTWSDWQQSANKVDIANVNQKITTQQTSIDQNANQIALKADTTTVNTLTGRVTTAEGNITTMAGQISLKANQSDVDTVTKRVTATESSLSLQDGKITALTSRTDGNSTKIGNLQTSYDGLSSTVATVQTSVSNINTSNTNLLIRKNEVKDSMVGSDGTIQNWNGSSVIGYSDRISVTGGESLYFSQYYANMSADNYFRYAFYNSTGTLITRAVNNTINFLVVVPSGASYLRVSYATANKVKVERGNSNTGFVLNPEDTATFVQYSNLSQTVSSLQSTVADKASTAQVTLLSTQVTSVVSDVSTQKSQITQLSDNINLRVMKNDVVNQINVSTESILIAGNKVQITGQTYIANAVISTAAIADAAVTNAKISSLSASKLTAGTIDANIITVKNINASNINTGTLSANYINGGTINGANVNVINLNANNITAGTLSGSNLSINLSTGAVNFQKGTIQKYDGSFLVDVTNGVIESYQSGGGFTLSNGSIELRDSSFFNQNSGLYGKISYIVGFSMSSPGQGIGIQGKVGWSLSKIGSSLGFFERSTGSGIFGSTDVNIFAEDTLTLQAGSNKSGNYAQPPQIIVGCNYRNLGNVGADIYLGANFILLNAQLGLSIAGKTDIVGKTTISGDFNVYGSKNAVHVTRDGVRATPAYETAESYLGDIGQDYTRENCEVWVDIETLFSDTVNTNISYQVFLQAYDDARFWVAEFRADKFLIKSDKAMSRFAWEIKAKRRGYEDDRLVLQEDADNNFLLKAHEEGAF